MNQIKLCEIELERLKDDKPLFFQKKKIEEYNKHIEIINDKISNYYIELNKELDILCKLEQAI